MVAWKSLIRVRAGALGAAFCCIAPAAPAGHEISYFPSFYPQEIRIEPLDPDAAAREFVNTKDPLHAYLGAAPRFTGGTPGDLKSVASLTSFVTANVDPRRVRDRDERCRAVAGAADALTAQPDVVPHRYPVTPYHADYLDHADRTVDAKPAAAAAAAGAKNSPEADVRFDEVPIQELLRSAGGGANAWPAPPWAKDGWFQAYRLLRPAVSDAADRERADAIYQRLTHGEFKDQTEQLNLARGLVAELARGCERAVVGYRLRREFYTDDFSGIENILVDSQSGFNSPVFVRTVKLKDFPWNGWLRLGIDRPGTAAWNPIAGFTDPLGRLVWSTVGDDAFLAVPHNSRWVQNRVEALPDDSAKARQSIRVPADAVMPQPGTGRIAPVGAGRAAMAKVSYRVLASAFHDGSEMETADLVYPYALAFRCGVSGGEASVFDAEVAAATEVLRERLKGVRVDRVEEKTLKLADLTFTYRSPIVEVFLDDPSAAAEQSALLAPPWSSVPWHVLALMEAAVERGLAAFSRTEAERRQLPWLDLVRDQAQLAKLRALIKEFAASRYRPPALEGLVGPEAAAARWEALDAFAEAAGHLLVTNGPYRLASVTPDAVVLNVVRDFTYPVGIGTFDPFAYPSRAIITGIERKGDRIVVGADVEIARKQQRDRKVVRLPLKRDTLRETYPIHPEARYVVVGEDGNVAASGNARWEPDGRFAASLPPLPPGTYTFLTAVLLDGNAINPEIGRIVFEKK